MKNKIKLLLLMALTAVGLVSCDENEDLLPNTIAGFTFSPVDNIQVGDTVYFTNKSEEAISYLWDFGDDVISTEINPFHVYNEPGIFEISLVATNGDVMKIATQLVTVVSDLNYIVNYGSYSGDKGTITAFDKYADEVVNGYYKTVNGVDMVSNVQYVYNYKNNIYLLGNNADQVFWVNDKTFQQTANGITEDIVKPRYCVGRGDYLYVSCWGGDIWADESLSYIAKVNLTTNSVENKIALPGGPEGLAIVNEKLYATLNYKDSVAVIDLAGETVSYIETPAVSSYFVKDTNDNLYVSLVSTYSDYSENTGLGYINTNTDELETTYLLSGISTSYVNILAPNDDFSKIYVMTSAYDANWNLNGAIAVFDVASKTFENNMFLEGVTGMNGLGFQNDKVFCFVSESVTGNGKAITYSVDGARLNEYETGIAPFMLLDIE